jgi:hypothetical protein
VEEHYEELLPGCTTLLFIVVYSKLFPMFENSHIDTWVQFEVPWVKAGNLKSQASRKQRPINIEHDTVGCLLA